MKSDYDWMLPIVKEIEKCWEEERYIDADGTLWFGHGDDPDEVWITDNPTDGVLTKSQMMRKMCRELLDSWGKEESTVA